jgi:hypothetical protein
MSETYDDDEIIEIELKMLRNKLDSIHSTLKISMACIIVLLTIFLIVVFFMLWYSPSF